MLDAGKHSLFLEGCSEHFEYLHGLPFCENIKQYLNFKMGCIKKKVGPLRKF